jgi:hypothetical protein
MRTLAIAATVLAAGGCYSYQPLKGSAPVPDSRVVIQLTDAGALRLSGYLGRNSASVDGRVMSVSDSVLQLSVVAVHAADGQVSYWNGEPIDLPRDAIAGIRERHLAKGSTVLVGGIVTAALVGVTGALTGGFTGGNGGGPPPPPK